MASHPENLRSQRVSSNCQVPGCPIFPVLPVIAAAPSGKDQDSQLVSEVEKVVRLQLPFQPNGVQVHIANVAQLRLQAVL